MKIEKRLDIDLSAIRRRHKALIEERREWLNTWRDIKDFIAPSRGRFAVDSQHNRIDFKKFIDEEPFIALRALASGMQSGLTSPAVTWFRLGLTDPELSKYHPVRIWLDDSEERMLQLFNRSNLYNSLHSCYMEEAAFGTACVMCLDDPNDLVRFKTLTCGEYALGADAAGRIDTFARSFMLPTAAIIKEYGIENVPHNVRIAYENNNTESQWEIHQLIEPNDDRILNMKGAAGMPWRSVHFMDGNYNAALRVGGYEEFPVMTPRWEVVGNDVYGSESPGMMALGASMMLQSMQNDSLEAIEKMIRPPLQGPADQKIRGDVSFKAGAVNYYNSAINGSSAPFTPLFAVNFDISGVQLKINESENRIQRLFYTDLFLLLQQGDSKMTATEATIKDRERLLMLGPVVERQENELLSPIIKRVFAIMLRSGALLPPPDEAIGYEIKVEYISTLAQAQKAVSVGNVEQLFGFVSGIANADPSVMDVIDTTEAVYSVTDAFGVPAKIIRSKEVIDAMRQQRAEAQQQAEMQQQMSQTAQLAPGIAQAAKSLGDTDMSNLNQNLGG